MKKLAKTMAILLILIAGSHIMLGQNTFLINEIQPLLAYASDIQNDIELSAEVTARSYQFYMEEKVQLEDWMIEQSEWKQESATNFASATKVDSETELTAATWMIRPFSAFTSEPWDFLEEEQEEPLRFHRWMICCADWNIKVRQNNASSIPAILE